MTFNVFSLNGNIRPIAEATVPIANIEYAYGFGVYETVRVIGGVPYFAAQHAERLLSSAVIIDLAHGYSKNDIEKYLGDLAKELPATEACNLKAILVGGQAPLLYIFPSAPRFPERTIYRDGVRTMIARYERPFPNAKTLSMLESYLAFSEARRRDCYEALILGRDGKITEGTASNFFLIKGNTIYTAPKERILEGVTMKIVLALAAKNGFTVETGSADPSELSTYDGAFLTSTSSKVVPISQIDDYVFPPVPETVKTLIKLYDELLYSCAGIFKEKEK